MEIVAGLICENAEIFGANGVNHTIFGGRRILFSQSPAEILEAVDNTMDDTDHRCLDEMGIFDIHARRDQWATCNLSSYDHIPDYVTGRKTLTREFVLCSKRGQCSAEGELCRTQEQTTGLTTRELEFIEYALQGLLNKEIAHKMGVVPETAESHSQNIRIKIGAARKADLVRIAQKLNLKFQNNDSHIKTA